MHEKPEILQMTAFQLKRHKQRTMSMKNRDSRRSKESRHSQKKDRPKGIDIFTVDQLVEYEIAFDEYDIDADGLISNQELAKLLRNLGMNPTEKEIEGYIRKYDLSETGKLDLEDFYLVMHECMCEIDVTGEVREVG